MTDDQCSDKRIVYCLRLLMKENGYCSKDMIKNIFDGTYCTAYEYNEYLLTGEI